ncbi:hypothetical protein HETIRDRAFT_164031 [Heterobasidion irregulare TC 32-1]|uniref:Uncharacterized protein n=1 Tax=Heterobasidion irregulare (strain TC 32-1) TaxID=747525 RepID=W4JWX2_HETIT|nr:uncharacterized protein HETIRDRAFT_164031 [Heterobasidion irregulare TC 32-1]ETW78058.1 hypothetical protein HETIRDRAFT_164031 [Heterobasidion irregulare TC 32-1]
MCLRVRRMASHSFVSRNCWWHLTVQACRHISSSFRKNVLHPGMGHSTAVGLVLGVGAFICFKTVLVTCCLAYIRSNLCDEIFRFFSVDVVVVA